MHTITMTAGQLAALLACIAALAALVSYCLSSRDQSVYGHGRGKDVPKERWTTGNGDNDVFGVGMKSFKRGCVYGTRVLEREEQEKQRQKQAQLNGLVAA